ncbi:MAG: SAM-dependent methyltransferase [Betaproteobacteria bacterium]|nr:SAM-dependent methyltransferase [Betaproteobacteria bacterium]
MRTPLPRSLADTLPVPEGAALAHSQACAEMLRAEINKAGGWLSFARFMELALYTPGLGYYAAGARKFGAAGDFVTAPEISSLFGQTLASSIADVLRQTGGDVLELGPGSGKLAKDVLMALDDIGVLPERYRLLEVSADLRERQQQALSALPASLAARVEWLDALPQDFTGVMIANEVLDVIPAHLVTWRAGGQFERGVALNGDDFIWQDVPAAPEISAAMTQIQGAWLNNSAPDDYVTEVAPAVTGLVRSLAQSLKLGAMLFIDYGFRGAEFYHPSRITGTLMCHYRHFAHPDPFLYPGLQDITAHVDFSSVAEAGTAAGLQLAGYTTQAHFLLASGLPDLLAKADPRDPAQYLPLTNQFQRLVSPAEMGEFFKVIGFTSGEVTIPALAKARPLPV